MKFLFDQNVSHRILQFLPDQFADSQTVKQVYLMNAPDKEVWDFAKRNGFIIVTQDSDFNDLNTLFGFPPKIIWIRTGNLSTKEIAEILRKYYTELQSFFHDASFGCFEIFNVRNI